MALNVILLGLLPPFWTVQCVWTRVAIGMLLYCIVFSRLMEIFYAFYYDVLEKLNEKGDQKTALSKMDRIRLAAQSYVEVSVCFAILYRALPLSYFSNPATGPYRFWITRPFNWLYFSWITITTTGYGDVTPRAAIAKGLTMIEIAFGLMLIVFAVGAYLSSKNGEGHKENR